MSTKKPTSASTGLRSEVQSLLIERKLSRQGLGAVGLAVGCRPEQIGDGLGNDGLRSKMEWNE